jgi:hypothetical protein
MTVVKSAVSPTSAAFKANAEAMGALVAELKEKMARAALGGNEKSRATPSAANCCHARVERLIDPGSPFLELSPLAANAMYEGDIHAAGIITGIGQRKGYTALIDTDTVAATVIGGINANDDSFDNFGDGPCFRRGGQYRVGRSSECPFTQRSPCLFTHPPNAARW